MDSIVVKADGYMITVSASLLDAGGADSVIAAIDSANIWTLDFTNVTDINFAAMRRLMNCRRGGCRFGIINAADRVACKLEDTGVSSFINVTRRPRHIDLSGYEEFGGGFMSKSFNSPDGDSMLKVYGPRCPRWMVANEKTTARAVMLFGIPTPLVGTLYEDGGNTALDFERIVGKRSFSRVISQEPERMEEMTVRFAAMCRKLHSTECDTSLFADRTVTYRRAVTACAQIPQNLKERLLRFIDSVPAATTCLHGDLQLSNVITAPGIEDMWIDLADFAYGNPMFDLGMWYFLAKISPEERQMHVFHLGHSQMSQIWDIFTREYFGAATPEDAAEAERSVLPFAGLHMVYLGATYGWEPGMVEMVEKCFGVR